MHKKRVIALFFIPFSSFLFTSQQWQSHSSSKSAGGGGTFSMTMSDGTRASVSSKDMAAFKDGLGDNDRNNEERQQRDYAANRRYALEHTRKAAPGTPGVTGRKERIGNDSSRPLASHNQRNDSHSDQQNHRKPPATLEDDDNDDRNNDRDGRDDERHDQEHDDRWKDYYGKYDNDKWRRYDDDYYEGEWSQKRKSTARSLYEGGWKPVSKDQDVPSQQNPDDAARRIQRCYRVSVAKKEFHRRQNAVMQRRDNAINNQLEQTKKTREWEEFLRHGHMLRQLLKDRELRQQRDRERLKRIDESRSELVDLCRQMEDALRKTRKSSKLNKKKIDELQQRADQVRRESEAELWRARVRQWLEDVRQRELRRRDAVESNDRPMLDQSYLKRLKRELDLLMQGAQKPRPRSADEEHESEEAWRARMRHLFEDVDRRLALLPLQGGGSFPRRKVRRLKNEDVDLERVRRRIFRRLRLTPSVDFQQQDDADRSIVGAGQSRLYWLHFADGSPGSRHQKGGNVRIVQCQNYKGQLYECARTENEYAGAADESALEAMSFENKQAQVQYQSSSGGPISKAGQGDGAAQLLLVALVGGATVIMYQCCTAIKHILKKHWAKSNSLKNIQQWLYACYLKNMVNNKKTQKMVKNSKIGSCARSVTVARVDVSDVSPLEPEQAVFEKRISIECAYCPVYNNDVAQDNVLADSVSCEEVVLAVDVSDDPLVELEQTLSEKRMSIECEYCPVYKSGVAQDSLLIDNVDCEEVVLAVDVSDNPLVESEQTFSEKRMSIECAYYPVYNNDGSQDSLLVDNVDSEEMAREIDSDAVPLVEQVQRAEDIIEPVDLLPGVEQVQDAVMVQDEFVQNSAIKDSVCEAVADVMPSQEGLVEGETVMLSEVGVSDVSLVESQQPSGKRMSIACEYYPVCKKDAAQDNVLVDSVKSEGALPRLDVNCVQITQPFRFQQEELVRVRKNKAFDEFVQRHKDLGFGQQFMLLMQEYGFDIHNIEDSEILSGIQKPELVHAFLRYMSLPTEFLHRPRHKK